MLEINEKARREKWVGGIAKTVSGGLRIAPGPLLSHGGCDHVFLHPKASNFRRKKKTGLDEFICCNILLSFARRYKQGGGSGQ